MKVFVIKWSSGNETFICSKTNIEALRLYYGEIGIDFMTDGYDEDSIEEIPAAEWHQYTITDDDNEQGFGKSFTLTQFMSKAVEAAIIAEHEI